MSALWLVLASLCAAAPELTLPKGVEARWVIPPSPSAAPVDELSVDPKGNVWLAARSGAVFAPEKNVLFQADRPVEQLVWLGSLQLARAGENLAVLEKPRGASGAAPRVHVRTLEAVALSSWRLASGGADSVLIAGYNPRKKVSQVAELDGAKLSVVYESEAQISDAASDGKNVYVAAGGAVWKLGAPGAPASVFYAHPKRAARRLAAGAGGVFFATAEGVGFAGPSSELFFLRAPKCRLAVAGDALYVMPGGLAGGVLRLTNLAAFARAAD